MTRICWI